MAAPVACSVMRRIPEGGVDFSFLDISGNQINVSWSQEQLDAYVAHLSSFATNTDV